MLIRCFDVASYILHKKAMTAKLKSVYYSKHGLCVG